MYSLKSYEEPGGIKTGVRSGTDKDLGKFSFSLEIRSGLDTLHAETTEREEIVDRVNGRDRDQL